MARERLREVGARPAGARARRTCGAWARPTPATRSSPGSDRRQTKSNRSMIAERSIPVPGRLSLGLLAGYVASWTVRALLGGPTSTIANDGLLT